MKKKKFIISIILLIFIIFTVFFINSITWKLTSPTGDYEIVGWLIDQGGFGYSGAFYIKEKGLFSKWHKLGEGPSDCTWLSDNKFSVRFSYFVDEDYYKEFSVDEFFE